jgi:DMSO/TMAO reductase YedYZ molybdopterin-dependent catalytic subunit
MAKLTRRELLRGSLIAGGTLLAGLDQLAWGQATARLAGEGPKDPFFGGEKIGNVEFSGEIPIEMDVKIGEELDGRLYTDLSVLTPERATIATKDFYLRSCASKLLPDERTWTIRVTGGDVEQRSITVPQLTAMERPMGVHLMECAGNTREFHFGLMSAASWSGVLIEDVLKMAKIDLEGGRILVSGFDKYEAASTSSIPGASWIFTREELEKAHAFLATKMNGEPLTKDHGAPIRLVIPGWYGCTCIKWVDQIRVVNDDAAATSQMQEYAARTHQQGVPGLAKEFRSATIDHAATPIRVERWAVGSATKYKVVGILWGGAQPARKIEIRFNPEEEYVPVDNFAPEHGDSWSFWSHAWSPRKPGTYLIRLRVKEPAIPAKRLDAGFYMRAVEIE